MYIHALSMSEFVFIYENIYTYKSIYIGGDGVIYGVNMYIHHT
jgi:hypothetical protein